MSISLSHSLYTLSRTHAQIVMSRDRFEREAGLRDNKVSLGKLLHVSTAFDDKTRKITETFSEKVILLLVTALLTGILVPYINGRLARQASVLQEQKEFLGELERRLYEFHTKAAAVCWYRSQAPDESKFGAAVEAYDAASWKFMSDMHAAVSKARRLSSPEAYRDLARLQHKWEMLDLELTRLSQSDQRDSKVWLAMLERVNVQAGQTGIVMQTLARDYGLSP